MKNTFPISLTTNVRRNETKFLANSLGEELVMMNMENGDFVSMNKVGADIWQICQQPKQVKEIIQQLLALYNISEEQCISETMQFLQAAIEENMFIPDNIL